MIDTIRKDLQAFYAYPEISSLDRKMNFGHFLKAILDIDFRAIFIYRFSKFFIKLGLKKIGILLYYRLKAAHAIDISPYAEIAPGLKIVHAFNIVIGPGVVIGKNCVIFNSITLGNSHPGWKKDKSDKDMPSIGDRVTLCPGSRIIGNIILGHDVFIGANSVVVKNIPNYETWAGVPAKKISKKNIGTDLNHPK